VLVIGFLVPKAKVVMESLAALADPRDSILPLHYLRSSGHDTGVNWRPARNYQLCFGCAISASVSNLGLLLRTCFPVIHCPCTCSILPKYVSQPRSNRSVHHAHVPNLIHRHHPTPLLQEDISALLITCKVFCLLGVA
jgi:hypothetical protein